MRESGLLTAFRTRRVLRSTPPRGAMRLGLRSGKEEENDGKEGATCACSVSSDGSHVLRCGRGASLALLSPGSDATQLVLLRSDESHLRSHVTCASPVLDPSSGGPAAVIALARSRSLLCVPSLSDSSPAFALGSHPAPLSATASAPSVYRLASADVSGSIFLWDTFSGSLIASSQHAQNVSVRSLCLSHNASALVSGASDGSLRTWAIDERSQRLISFVSSDNHSPITAVAISSPSSRQSDSYPPSVCLANTSSVAAVLDDRVDAFTGDERIAAGTADGFVHVWRPDPPGRAAPQLHREALCAYDEGFYIQCLAFRPDGSSLAVSCSEGGPRRLDHHVRILSGDHSWRKSGWRRFQSRVLCLSYLRYKLPITYLLAVPASHPPTLLDSGLIPPEHDKHGDENIAVADKRSGENLQDTAPTNDAKHAQHKAEDQEAGHRYEKQGGNTSISGRHNPPLPSLAQLRGLDRSLVTNEEVHSYLSSSGNATKAEKNGEDSRATQVMSMGQRLEEALHGAPSDRSIGRDDDAQEPAARSPEALPQPSPKAGINNIARRQLLDEGNEEDEEEEHGENRVAESRGRPEDHESISGSLASGAAADTDDEEEPPQPTALPKRLQSLAVRHVDEPIEDADGSVREIHAEDVVPETVSIYTPRRGMQETEKQNEANTRRLQARNAERRLARRQKSEKDHAGNGNKQQEMEEESERPAHPLSTGQANSTQLLEQQLKAEQESLKQTEQKLEENNRTIAAANGSDEDASGVDGANILSQYSDLVDISKAEASVPSERKRRVRKQTSSSKRKGRASQQMEHMATTWNALERQQQFRISGPRHFDPAQTINWSVF